MTWMIGSRNATSPAVAGSARSATARSAAERFVRNPSRSPAAASRDTRARLAMPIATPNKPIGSWMSRNARESQVIGPFP
jgi:hypothetical protein